MTETALDPYPAELRSLETRKRRVYTVAAATGIVVAVLSWATRDADDVVVAVVYPLLAVALGLFAVAMNREWASLRVLERSILGVLSLVILGRLAWHLHLGGHIDEHLLVLTGGHYWAVATLIIAGFVLLDRRLGLWFGIGVLGVSVLLVVTGAGAELVGPDGSSQALLYLVRLHAFLILLLVLVLAVATLREQLHRALARAEASEELAATDPLTGLANRRRAVDVLDREIRAAERYGRTVSVVVADLDHFKLVNDAHGHQVGDQVLADVGRTLLEEARDVDLVVRWGGEEFLIVAPGITRDDAVRMAERFRAALSMRRPGGLEITATFGVTQHTRGQGLEALLLRADQLLYDAKSAGRDQVLGDASDHSSGSLVDPDGRS